MAKSRFTQEDDDILSELGVEVESKKKAAYTPKEERIIAGFEEIQRFVEDSGRLPSSKPSAEIFERLYATRLNQILKEDECRNLLSALDHQGLLEGKIEKADIDSLTDEELLSELGVGAESYEDITQLRHVKSRAQKRVAEEIANRTPCEDFEKFKPLFDVLQSDLDLGMRHTQPFRKDAGFTKTDIKKGQFFVLGGQTAYVASVGESRLAPNGELDARLRVIYANKTESDILLRSVIRALYKDETSRLISDPIAGPLFGQSIKEDDAESGTIYVLRSKSDHPSIKKNREVLHKIGVTGGSVEKRISGAAHDATYLLADVEVVATFKLFNMNRKKFENVIHKFFSPAQLHIDMNDRFGNSVEPREWFLVPFSAIEEAIERVLDGSITDYLYDISQAKLVKS